MCCKFRYNCSMWNKIKMRWAFAHPFICSGYALNTCYEDCDNATQYRLKCGNMVLAYSELDKLQHDCSLFVLDFLIIVYVERLTKKLANLRERIW